MKTTEDCGHISTPTDNLNTTLHSHPPKLKSQNTQRPPPPQLYTTSQKHTQLYIAKNSNNSLLILYSQLTV